MLNMVVYMGKFMTGEFTFIFPYISFQMSSMKDALPWSLSSPSSFPPLLTPSPGFSLSVQLSTNQMDSVTWPRVTNMRSILSNRGAGLLLKNLFYSAFINTTSEGKALKWPRLRQDVHVGSCKLYSEIEAINETSWMMDNIVVIISIRT